MSCKDIGEATNTAQHVVRMWMVNRGGIPVKKYDLDLTFYQPRPDGYNQTLQRYQLMCDELDVALSRQCQKRVRTPDDWRDTHRTNKIKDFIAALAILMLQSPNQPQAPQVIAWLDQ